MATVNDDPGTQPRVATGMLLAVAGTFLFALKSIFIKLAYAQGVGVEALLMLRMLIALPFYVAMLVYLHARSQLAASISVRQVLLTLLLGFLGYYLASYLDLLGLTLISAQLERLTLFTYPAIIAVLGWWFHKERITFKTLAALLLCYGGLLLMYGEEARQAQGEAVLAGVLLVLGAALSFSVYVIFAKGVIAQLGSRCFTSVAMIGSTAFVAVHFGLSQPWQALNVSGIVWVYAILLALVSTLIPSFMVSEAIARIGATRTAIAGSIGPVFTLVLAVVWLGEPTSWSHFAGTLLVILGVLLVN